MPDNLNHKPVFLGIDTGGTFTDGVLLEPTSHTVVKTIKVLTTHQDLKICIGDVLEKLLPEDPSSIALVSLSTTLATNAIAEGKRKPVGLLLLGYDAGLVREFNFHQQFGTSQYAFIEGRHNLNGVEQVPLDEAQVAETAAAVMHQVEAFAISSYAGMRNPAHEERAGEILAGLTSHPVVQAHHLSSELDSIRRATTASLNASLLSSAHEFLNAVQAMLVARGVHCPVMIVRGDGSIVKADFARKRPVEIIHSGPATSAIGGQFLSQAKSALVIDIGGTTTDIALVEDGKVQALENAATVGPYRTCVRTIKVRSFGLGGDSLVRFDYTRRLSIGPDRVIPISHFVTQYPECRQDLFEWLAQKKDLRYSEDAEYIILRREPLSPFSEPRTLQALELLRTGPQRLSKLLKTVGAVSPIQINLDDMIAQEVVDRAALTPTDLLHISGEFTPWDEEAARLLTRAAAKHWDESPDGFVQRVKDAITGRIVEEIVQFLSGKSLSAPALAFKDTDLDRWLYDESLSPRDPYLGCRIFLRVPLVGIGAPASAFLPPVAAALGARIILPEHYEVANAVGTVVGSVIVHQSGAVTPEVEGSSVLGYFSRVANHQERFADFQQALDFTREKLSILVADEARSAGAEAPQVGFEEHEVLPGMIVNFSAWAVGKPGMDGGTESKTDPLGF
jgi:N-methylhydantoinase A/oxoprolinase/acetone carboxylase beta subunit